MNTKEHKKLSPGSNHSVKIIQLGPYVLEQFVFQIAMRKVSELNLSFTRVVVVVFFGFVLFFSFKDLNTVFMSQPHSLAAFSGALSRLAP